MPGSERQLQWTLSIKIVRDLMEGRMYSMTVKGLEEGMKALR